MSLVNYSTLINVDEFNEFMDYAYSKCTVSFYKCIKTIKTINMNISSKYKCTWKCCK